MSSPYSLPDQDQRPHLERKPTSRSSPTPPKEDPPSGARSFTVHDDSVAAQRKKSDHECLHLRKVMSDLCHSGQVGEEEELNNSQTQQERRYDMRIRSLPSNEAARSKSEDESSATLGFKAERRVTAGSKVNFIFLNEDEQVARYKNLRIEYKALKKELAQKEKHYYDTYSKTSHKSSYARRGLSKTDRGLLEARDKLKTEKFQELPECENILQNLAECLATGAMKGDSLELGLICNLVRKVKMGISSREGLSLMTRTNTFIKERKREQIVSFLTGKQAPEFVKPKAAYSFIAYPFQYPAGNQVLQVTSSKSPFLTAQTTGNRVLIKMSQEDPRSRVEGTFKRNPI